MFNERSPRKRIPLQLGPGVGHHPDRRMTLGPVSQLAVPTAHTLRDALVSWAQVRPAQTALYFLDLEERLTPLTYGELLINARRIAAGLRARGIGRGARLLISLETGPELIEVFFAVVLLGAVPCVTDVPSAKNNLLTWRAKLRAKADLLDAAGLIIESDYKAQGYEALNGSRPGLPTSKRLFVCSPQELDVAPDGLELPVLSPDELAFVQFTSGTTRQARGVRITHRALLTNSQSLAEGCHWHSNELVVSWLPLFHDMGLVASTLAPFLHGLPTVLMPPMGFLLKPSRWLWAMHYFRATTSFAPNFAYQLCLKRIRDAELEGLELGAWHRAITGAELIHYETVCRFEQRMAPHGFRPRASNPGYGMAEMVVCVTVRHAHQPLTVDFISQRTLSLEGRAVPVEEDSADVQAFVSVGRPLAGYDVRIVDGEGQLLPDRREGEVLVRGPSLFDGYYNDSEATAEVLRDGWLHTGDLGYWVDGELFICGRQKDLIIRAGEHHLPYLLEYAASNVAGVRAGCVAAVGVSNPNTGTEDVVVVFETTETNGTALRQLCKSVEEQIWMVAGIRPDSVFPVPVQTLPKTSSGKLERGTVRALIASTALPRLSVG